MHPEAGGWNGRPDTTRQLLKSSSTKITYYVEVLLNREEDEDGRLAIFARFGDDAGYQSGDHLEQVWSGEVVVDEPEEDVLNRAFEMFNRGAPGFVGDVAYPHRSLSVGDVIRIDETDRYACASMGWKKLPL